MLMYPMQQNILLFVRYLIKHYHYNHHHNHRCRDNQHDSW